MTASRQQAEAMDAADPLGGWRDRFSVPDPELIYLDGNSLGRLPHATHARLSRMVREDWGDQLIRSWSQGWLELPVEVGDRIAAGLLGADAGQVVVADSTTVCLYKLAAAALAARPGRGEIVTDVNNFPTDRYVVESLAHERGATVRWLGADPSPAEVAAAVGPETALVTLSHVAYQSGRVLEMAAITEIAHEAGALVLWDLCHSVGSMPIALDASGADLAVGCTYKYLNGGPGAPAFIYVARRHQAELRQPIWGWVGASDPLAMGPRFEPAAGISAWISGTPPILALAAVAEGVELVVEAGIERIRSKAVALGDLATALADDWLAPLGARVESPRESAARGAHVAVSHPQAADLCRGLADVGVICDYRNPNILRLGLSPLTTKFVDVWDGLDRLRGLARERG